MDVGDELGSAVGKDEGLLVGTCVISNDIREISVIKSHKCIYVWPHVHYCTKKLTLVSSTLGEIVGSTGLNVGNAVDGSSDGTFVGQIDTEGRSVGKIDGA